FLICLAFSPNFLKHPNDHHVLEYRPRKSMSVDESHFTPESQHSDATAAPLPSENAPSRRDSVDCAKESKDKTIVKTTKIVEKKFNFEESKVKITEKVKERKPREKHAKGTAETGHKKLIPEIKVSPAESIELGNSPGASPCPSPCK